MNKSGNFMLLKVLLPTVHFQWLWHSGRSQFETLLSFWFVIMINWFACLTLLREASFFFFPYSCLCMKPMLSCSLTPSQRANWISNCFLYMINLEVKVWSSIKNSNFTFSKTCRSFFFYFIARGGHAICSISAMVNNI